MRHHLRRYGVVVAFGLFTACAAPESNAPDDGTPSGNAIDWSNTAAWPGGQVPVAGDSVVIPAGTTVRLDISPPTLHSLTIEGTLTFGNVDINLTTGWIVVNGTLRIGSESNPYTKRALITLTGTGAANNPDVAGMGNKMLGVTGTVEIHGSKRGGWTRLSNTAVLGATQLDLLDNPGWKPGDRIAIASSDFSQDRFEEAEVASVSGDRLTLTAPLKYEHYGEVISVSGTAVDERTEVGLLTRNITIQGDTGSTPGYGGHIMIMAGAIAHIEGVELFRMGQRAQLARYPMHWHMAGDVTGQYFRNNSVWRTFNRCVTVHGSDNATVEDNICFDHTGHGYFLEDGGETGNLIQGNLGFNSRVPAEGDRLLGSDSRPATFWITNPDNTVRRNHAAGSKGFGFWYALPRAPTGLSVGQPDLPRTTPLREFSGNVAHSNHSAGLNVDDGPMMDGNTEVTNYSPRATPSDGNSAPVIADFTSFRAFKHYGRAVWLRGSNTKLSNSLLADNAIGATFASNQTYVTNTTFIGVTGAINKLPSNTFLRGYEFYDGRVGAEDVRFINYNSSAATTVPASALGYNRNNSFPIDPLNYAGEMTFVNSNEFYLENPHDTRDGDKAAVFYDQSGDVTGTAGRFVAANTPIMITNACTLRSAWNSYVCTNRFVKLQVSSAIGAEVVAPLTVNRDDAVSLALSGTGNGTTHAALSAIPGRGYTVGWSGATPTRPRFYLNSGRPGDFLYVTAPLAAAPTKVQRDYYDGHPVTATASLAELQASTDGTKYYYDTGSSTLYLKMVVMADRDWATLFVR
jgi:cell migration-inducing and hyaluronan-binding protein